MELPVIGHCLVVLALLRNPNRNQVRHERKISMWSKELVVTSPKHNLRNLNKMPIYESISLHIIGFSQTNVQA